MFSSEVIKVLDDLSKRFGVAVDWTGANIMPYLQDLLHRIIRYEIATSIAWIVIFLLGIITCLFLIRYENKTHFSEGVITVICYVAIAACTVFIGMQAFDIITALTLPERTYLDMFYNVKNTLNNLK